MQSLTKITLSFCIGLTLGAGLFAGQAFAGAKPDQVHRLSEDLTPMGSERAGNADGTIPAWTGGITEPPAGYSPGDHHPSPWPDDKPLFRITGANYEEYGDKLNKQKVTIFVRRGGPNYPTGLKNIGALKDEIGLNIEVYGPETHMTNIVAWALDPKKSKAKRTPGGMY